MAFEAIVIDSLAAAWVVSEIVVNFRTYARPGSQQQDRASFPVLWITMLVSISLAILIKVDTAVFRRAGAISFLFPFVGWFGCLLVAAGASLRWVAISTLRKQFTVNVSIVEDHEVIDRGIYSSIRHPAYLGTLVAFAGLGLGWENWICLLVMFVPTLAAMLYRISVEEKALLAHFGSRYRRYMERTRKLIPGVY